MSVSSIGEAVQTDSEVEDVEPDLLTGMRDKFRLPRGVKAASSMLQRRGFSVWVWRLSRGTTIKELGDRRQEWLWQHVEDRGAEGE